ncbi:rCG24734 [Rattus norvegicus]|uniref:RCG24734 n=1 Tax=Rattus norvegicus TaxID=10116 RepID=A6JBW6_RAT|nr:rCG24734 [Rattus norvegicus]
MPAKIEMSCIGEMAEYEDWRPVVRLYEGLRELDSAHFCSWIHQS